MKNVDNTRAHELFLKLSDGSISGEEMSELDGLISENPRIAKRYNEFIAAFLEMEKKKHLFDSTGAALESIYKTILWKPLLEEEGADDVVELLPKSGDKEIEPAGVDSVKTKKQISRGYFYAAVLSAAALLAVVIIIQIFGRQPLVATVIESRQVRWKDEGPNVMKGQMLSIGSYSMKRGTLGLQLLQGAKVTITGPASFDLVSAKELFLHNGKLVADVPIRAIGFTVNTSTGKVVDLGTKFGVFVSRNASKTEVVVMDGVAKVKKKDSISRAKMLYGGSACSFSKNDGDIKEVSVSLTTFVEELIRAYKTTIRLSDPDAYWDFRETNDKRIENIFGRSKYEGRIEGDVDKNIYGLLGGRDSLSFGGGTEGRVTFNDENVFNPGRDSFTASIWFKPRSIDKEKFHVLASKLDYGSDDKKSGWQILFRNDTILIETITDSGEKVCVSKSVELAEQWHQIVMVIDRENQVLKGYFDGSDDGWKNTGSNGKEFSQDDPNNGTNKDKYQKTERIDNIQPFIVGSYLYTPKYISVVPYEGFLCDLAIWKHVLNKEEIKKIYDYGIKRFYLNEVGGEY